ncbi:hypothetical protein ALC57_06543 [Trachymyrmex cornetzi]|uniref:Calcineurin-like phosphoesterase domain-containing protein n=1 Tax=Trachymyrmex cornetzi TaxID=471704 RepID=A0A151J8C9_9HYME|nr:hypothetical protein ALC57_06543 [Trachymyrmex cornetzi]
MVKMFPGIPIFPALGNHESAPVNRYIRKMHVYRVNLNGYTNVLSWEMNISLS